MVLWELRSLLVLCSIAATRSRYSREECPSQAILDFPKDSRWQEVGLAEDDFPPESRWSSGGVTRGCICDVKPCLPLCCPRGKSVQRGKCTEDDALALVHLPRVYGTDLSIDEGVDPRSHFFFISGNPCGLRSGYLLDPEYDEEEVNYLLGNGSIYLPLQNETSLYSVRDFCYFISVNDTGYSPRVCAGSNVDHSRVGPIIGTVVSLPFLIATFVVYVILPDLKNLHGLTLRCYVGCLTVSYLFLAIDRLAPPDYYPDSTCQFFGFTVHFSFLASFLWLNVMCFDIWWTFGGFKSIRVSQHRNITKRFCIYSVYAWGVTSVFTITCLVMDFVPGIPETLIRPQIGVEGCWFKTKAAEALYFFGPLGLTILGNIGLFVSTAIKIITHERSAKKQLRGADSHRHDDNKKWFTIYLKLFVVMGVNWSTEFISWLWTGPEYIWYVTDMVNALQGFLIFVILVWKKKIRKSLIKRFHELRGSGDLSSKSPSSKTSQDSQVSVSTSCPDSEPDARGTATVKDIQLDVVPKTPNANET